MEIVKDTNNEVDSDVKEELEAVKKELMEMKTERDDAKKKYVDLTSKLRDQIECPVCLEVPTSGPLPVCPNGHFVCSKCKRGNCPTCRSRMFSGNSLLANVVIENIEHKCKHEECEELFPLSEVESHIKACKYRQINCPAPSELCVKKLAYCKLLDHLLNDCEGSWNVKGARVQVHCGIPITIPWTNSERVPFGKGDTNITKGKAYLWNDTTFFYMNNERLEDSVVFSIIYFGDEDECMEYGVDIAVHSVDDSDMKGKHVFRMVGEPLPIEMEEGLRRKSGLIIGDFNMNKIALKKDEKWCINVTFIIK